MSKTFPKYLIDVFISIVLGQVLYVVFKSIGLNRLITVYNSTAIILFFVLFISIKKNDLMNKISEDKFINKVSILFGSTILCQFLLIFNGLPFYLNALDGDYSLHTAIVVKALSSNSLSDPSYKGLHNFYPPLYHWFAAFWASALGKGAHEGIKYSAIFFMFFSFWGSFIAWVKFGLEKHVSLLASILLICFFPVIYKPFEFLSVLLFVPWSLSLMNKDSFTKKELALYSLVGGIIFLTYYYWFFVLGLWIILKIRHLIGGNIKNIFLVLLGSAIVSMIFWGPYLIDLFSNYPFKSLNNRWMKPEHVNLNIILAKFNIHNLLTISGVASLIVFKRINEKLFKQGLELISVVILFYFFGSLLMFKGSPILHMRSIHIVHILLMLSFAYYLRDKFQNYRRELTIIVMVFSIPYLVQKYTHSGLYKKTIKNKNLISNYSEVKNFENDLKNKVVLTNDAYLNAVIDTNLYINFNAHFSHPASKFVDRLNLLVKTNKASEMEKCNFLRKNKFNSVDYLYLNPKKKFYVLGDRFPTGHKRFNLDASKWESLPCVKKISEGLYKVTQVSN